MFFVLPTTGIISIGLLPYSGSLHTGKSTLQKVYQYLQKSSAFLDPFFQGKRKKKKQSKPGEYALLVSKKKCDFLKIEKGLHFFDSFTILGNVWAIKALIFG